MAKNNAQPITTQTPRILTVAQVADLLQIPKSSVYEKTRIRRGSRTSIAMRRCREIPEVFRGGSVGVACRAAAERVGAAETEEQRNLQVSCRPPAVGTGFSNQLTRSHKFKTLAPIVGRKYYMYAKPQFFCTLARWRS